MSNMGLIFDDSGQRMTGVGGVVNHGQVGYPEIVHAFPHELGQTREELVCVEAGLFAGRLMAFVFEIRATIVWNRFLWQRDDIQWKSGGDGGSNQQWLK